MSCKAKITFSELMAKASVFYSQQCIVFPILQVVSESPLPPSPPPQCLTHPVAVLTHSRLSSHKHLHTRFCKILGSPVLMIEQLMCFKVMNVNIMMYQYEMHR